MKSMIYVKIDASEQSLLGEEVCRQLGIVRYHTDVKHCHESHAASSETALVPVVSSLAEFHKYPTSAVHPHPVEEMESGGIWMVEPSPCIEAEGLLVSPTALCGLV